MPSVSNQKAVPPERILVIDDLPLIPLAFQEVFRFLNPAATVDYSENIFTALSTKAYANTSFDLIITLSPEAHHRALEFTRTMAVDVVYWPTIDPTAVQGSRETILNAYRGVRESLQKRIKDAFDWQPMGGP